MWFRDAVVTPLNDVRDGDVAFRIMDCMSVTLGMPHFDRSVLKDAASKNMDFMLVALGMPHFEMSTLKDVASDNMVIGS